MKMALLLLKTKFNYLIKSCCWSHNIPYCLLLFIWELRYDKRFTPYTIQILCLDPIFRPYTFIGGSAAICRPSTYISGLAAIFRPNIGGSCSEAICCLNIRFGCYTLSEHLPQMLMLYDVWTSESDAIAQDWKMATASSYTDRDNHDWFCP